MTMVTIRYVQPQDQNFWFQLDRHLPEEEFRHKVERQQGYLLSVDGQPAGLLRYNLFWDSIPFCTLLFVADTYQQKGYGARLLSHWEADMKSRGCGMVLTSTQVDEQAQHFYRKCGYKDCGGLLLDLPGYAQPMELFLCKKLD